MTFNHFDAQGQAVMVDVSNKQQTRRIAVAKATVLMRPETLELIRSGQTSKGDVLGVARLAGISAAKKTADLIPLAHPLALHAVSIEFEMKTASASIDVQAKVTAVERTGVEMEAMVAASLAALTIYDMCKGVDRGISVTDVLLLHKDGGKSGLYQRDCAAEPEAL
ncbi:MAG: cyclic pyranopterin monophosphate synthase MoaC [Desulfuromonadales bacterium]|nr:cyclic pyranopterin monophosphate synthase MoaC [Desulfuromonadales bacterium]